jgi:hypothetical protein
LSDHDGDFEAVAAETDIETNISADRLLGITSMNMGINVTEVHLH